MDSVAEIWREIPGFEGRYEASSHGRVRSMDRVVRQKNRWGGIHVRQLRGMVLAPTVHHTGYLIVSLGRQRRLHQLVALAFNGPCPPGYTIDHVDTNKHNNRPENLEYVTNSENVKRQYKTGLLDNRGETNGKAVLNDDLVRKIRSYPKSVMAKVIAADLGLKPHNVHQVRRGAWAHVTA